MNEPLLVLEALSAQVVQEPATRPQPPK